MGKKFNAKDCEVFYEYLKKTLIENYGATLSDSAIHALVIEILEDKLNKEIAPLIENMALPNVVELSKYTAELAQSEQEAEKEAEEDDFDGIVH